MAKKKTAKLKPAKKSKKPKLSFDKYYRTPLWYAAFDGDLKRVKQNLAKGYNVNFGDNEGLTPLHIACVYGHLEVVRHLLECGADPNLLSGDDDSPLKAATLEASSADATEDHLVIVEILLEHGADPDQRSRWKRRPRDWASSKELKALYKAADKNIKPSQRTPCRRAPLPPHKERPEDQWKRDHLRLWDELVPPSGSAKTLQGEVIRIAGKLTREAYTNGNINWNRELASMWRFVGKTLDDAATFSKEERADIKSWVQEIIRDHKSPDTSGDGSCYYKLGEKVVAWVLAHPKPIPHKADANAR